MTTRERIIVRDATDTDASFVFSSWLRSYSESPFARGLRRRVFFERHHRLIEELLRRPSVTVRVAALASDPVVLLGWCAGEPGTLHYVYVKAAWRGIGIARRLVGEIPGGVRVYSHRTVGPHGRVERLIREHLQFAHFDPYAAFPALEAKEIA